MSAVFWLIDTVIDIYIWLLIAQAILSWLFAFGVVNRYNRGVAVIGDFLYRVTEPAAAADPLVPAQFRRGRYLADDPDPVADVFAAADPVRHCPGLLLKLPSLPLAAAWAACGWRFG